MRLVPLAAVLALVLSACGGGDDESAPTTTRVRSSASTTTTAARGDTTSSPSTTEATSDSAALEDGRHFGFLKAVDTDAGTVEFDLAEMLTGEEGRAAAEAAGAIGPGETLDNDYYIRNRNDRLRTLRLADDVKLEVIDWPNCCEPVDGDLAEWAELFRPGADTTGRYRGPTSPYWLTVRGGVVVTIHEQYLP